MKKYFMLFLILALLMVPVQSAFAAFTIGIKEEPLITFPSSDTRQYIEYDASAGVFIFEGTYNDGTASNAKFYEFYNSSGQLVSRVEGTNQLKLYQGSIVRPNGNVSTDAVNDGYFYFTDRQSYQNNNGVLYRLSKTGGSLQPLYTIGYYQYNNKFVINNNFFVYFINKNTFQIVRKSDLKKIGGLITFKNFNSDSFVSVTTNKTQIAVREWDDDSYRDEVYIHKVVVNASNLTANVVSNMHFWIDDRVSFTILPSKSSIFIDANIGDYISGEGYDYVTRLYRDQVSLYYRSGRPSTLNYDNGFFVGLGWYFSGIQYSQSYIERLSDGVKYTPTTNITHLSHIISVGDNIFYGIATGPAIRKHVFDHVTKKIYDTQVFGLGNFSVHDMVLFPSKNHLIITGQDQGNYRYEMMIIDLNTNERITKIEVPRRYINLAYYDGVSLYAGYDDGNVKGIVKVSVINAITNEDISQETLDDLENLTGTVNNHETEIININSKLSEYYQRLAELERDKEAPIILSVDTKIQGKSAVEISKEGNSIYLVISAHDNQSKLQDMEYIVRRNGGTWSTWQPVSSNGLINVYVGSGINTYEFKVRDQANNESTIYKLKKTIWGL